MRTFSQASDGEHEARGTEAQALGAERKGRRGWGPVVGTASVGNPPDGFPGYYCLSDMSLTTAIARSTGKSGRNGIVRTVLDPPRR